MNLPPVSSFNPRVYFQAIMPAHAPLITPPVVYSKFIHALAGKPTAEVIAILQHFYGERLIQKALSTLQLQHAATFTEQDIKLLQICIATDVTKQDLKLFYEKITDLANNSLFKDCFPQTDLVELETLITLKRFITFDQLGDAQINTLLKFFRNESYDQAASKAISLKKTDSQRLKHLCPRTHRKASTVAAVEKYKTDHLPQDFEKLPLGEYLSRHVAYTSLEPGLIVPIYVKEGVTEFYEVNHAIFENGFGYQMIRGISPKNRPHVQVLFKGTDPKDPASISNNFAESSGAKIFAFYKATIFEALKVVCNEADRTDDNLLLSICGHSQGAALSQHLIAAMINDMAHNRFADDTHSFDPIKRFKVTTWCSPRILEANAKQLADDLSHHERHPRTNDIKVLFEDCVVAGDFVPTLGEEHVASRIYTENAFRRHFVFEPTTHGYIGAHCGRIFYGNITPKILTYLTDDKSKEELQQQLINQTFKMLTNLHQWVRPVSMSS